MPNLDNTDSQALAAELPLIRLLGELCSPVAAPRAFHSLLRDLARLAGARAESAAVLQILKVMPEDSLLARYLWQCMAAGDAVITESELSVEANGEPLTGPQVARLVRGENLAILETLKWYRRTYDVKPPVRTVRVGGRKSRLSLVQLDEVQEYLFALAPDISLSFLSMDTPGDRDKSRPLPAVTDDDFFTRDLDLALKNCEIDLAVHSAKDLPDHLPEGLRVAAVTPSLSPAECLITQNGGHLDDLQPGAVIGISSERRQSSLLALRPDLEVKDIRGNVPDRIRQVENGSYDGVVLAAVGLSRLGLQHHITQVFTAAEFPHAAGQGQLALMIREDDAELAGFLRPLDLGDRAGMEWAAGGAGI